MSIRNINDTERKQWVLRHPELLTMQESSGLTLLQFVVARRPEIDAHIRAQPATISAQSWHVPDMLTVPLPKPKRGRPVGSRVGPKSRRY